MDTSLEQMGGITVAQGVDGGALSETTRFEGRPQSVLHTVAGHGGWGRGHAEATPTRRGKAPERVTRGAPVLPQPRQGLWWQGHRAVLGPCAAPHLDAHPRTITIRPLEGGAVLEAEAARRDRGQARPRAEEA